MIAIGKVRRNMRKREYLFIKKDTRRKMKTIKKLYRVANNQCSSKAIRELIKGAHQRTIYKLEGFIELYNYHYKCGGK